MSTAGMTERAQSIEIDVGAGNAVNAMAFSAGGKYIVSGNNKKVQVWRTEDGQQTASMLSESDSAYNVAVSKNGAWIAAGTWSYRNRGSTVFVWDAKTHEQTFSYKDPRPLLVVDFSPDSTKLVVGSDNGTVTIWDVVKGDQVHEFAPLSAADEPVLAAKYSPQGDRIVTATEHHLGVWNSNDGSLLVEMDGGSMPGYNQGLVWSNDHLFVLYNKIKKIDASTWETIAEWSVLSPGEGSSIAVPKHGRFIAYSNDNTVTFYDTSTYNQLALIQHTQDVASIAFFPDDQFLAIGGENGKITIQNLSHIKDLTSFLYPAVQKVETQVDDNTSLDPSMPLSQSHPSFQEPEIHIDDAVLYLWENDKLEYVDAQLTTDISRYQNPSHHTLAARALVRTRLRKWDDALTDAEMAIELQPSPIAFIAKSIAHVGKGERYEGYRTCDIAFERFHSSHVTFLLLVKAIVVFMAGEHPDAISRVDDLIANVRFNSVCYTVQAYMHLLIGISQAERKDHDGAIYSFERARGQLRDYAGPPLFLISLISGWEFDNLGTTIRRHLCEALFAAGRTKEAVECFHELNNESEGNLENLQWVLRFGYYFSKELEHLGDVSVDAKRYHDAISYYSTALSLVRTIPRSILIKRSKAWLMTESWKHALDDANEVIALDPSSPWGYEIKHAALHKAGDYDNAIEAFETMLSKMVESRDQDIQGHRDQYISPSRTREAICKIVQGRLRRLPRVLINTITGRLHNRAEQASAFESLPIFKELISSMTTHIDYTRIKREVQQFFRYVVLSHKWEDNEPSFQQVVHIAVYDLDESPTHDKLQTFCTIARDAGFQWAWSDTCCINKSDHFVLQEALVAMFRWYRDSAMMIVFLRGVRTLSPRGALAGSVWNTRGWTLQEYIAAKVVRFYTEDWTLYRDLDVPDHKECVEIISEMEQATGVSTQQLMALRPGLSGIREKLCLASNRQTTLVEDAAYSLLGIFSAVGIHAIYGEGQASLGRLLANLLTRSGDASILAWVGDSSTFNTCLPARITVFDGSATSHLPAPILDSEMERFIVGSHTPSFDLETALRLYDRLNGLPTPRFAESRLSLPCIAFKLPTFSSHRMGRVYRADSVPFGMVEVRTRTDLARMRSLYLVHPWLDALLEHADIHGDDVTSPSSSNSVDEGVSGEELHNDNDDDDDDNDASPPPASPVELEPMNREMGARRLAARLRQPFGALLFQLTSTRGRAIEYRRVAADGVIMVRFRDEVSLGDILENVRMIDVL